MAITIKEGIFVEGIFEEGIFEHGIFIFDGFGPENILLQENGSALLQENGDFIILDE